VQNHSLPRALPRGEIANGHPRVRCLQGLSARRETRTLTRETPDKALNLAAARRYFALAIVKRTVLAADGVVAPGAVAVIVAR
jgi:hypothetical protein